MTFPFFKSVIMALVLLISVSAHAETEDAIDQVDTVMSNIGNQFVYAFFGKDLLLYYITDEVDRELVDATSDSELVLLAEPFNSQIGHFVRLGLNSVWLLTVGYFLFRMLAYAYEKVWSRQGQKKEAPTEYEFRGFVAKFILFGALALLPITLKPFSDSDSFSTKASIFNLPLFTLLGQAHQFSDSSMSELILTQRQSLSTVSMPKADAKWLSGSDLNMFFTCLRLSESRTDTTSHNVQLDVRLYNDRAYGVISEGGCHLSVSFGFDAKSDERIVELKKMVSDLPLETGLFKQAQQDVFKGVIDSAMSSAYSNSEVLTLDSSGDVETDSSLDDLVMKDWTSYSLSQAMLGSWENYCDEIKAFQFPNEEINGADRVLYNLLTSRCMSNDIVRPLLYPDTFGVLDDFFESGALKDRHLPLCVDQTKLASMSALNERFMPTYTIYSDVDYSSEIESLSLESCVTQYCSDSSLNAGGLYSCVNAMELYERRLKDHHVIDRGSMMIGFYMFSLFTNQMPSELSKQIFNQTEFAFSSEPIKVLDDEYDLLFSTQVKVPEVKESSTENWTSIRNELNTLDQKGYYTKLITKDPTNNDVLQSLLRINRLMTCVKNPLQVADGYVCGNIPQEFNAFGTNLIRLAIAGKTILSIGNAITVSRGNKETGTIGHAGVSRTSSMLASVFSGGNIAESVIDSYLNDGFALTDEFGFLSTSELKKYSSWSSVVYGLLLIDMSTASAAVNILDDLLLSILVIGLMFGIVMPLFPFLIVIGAIANFIFLFFKVLFLTGFKLTDIVFDDDPEVLSEKVDSLWADWVGLFLKLPLTVIGVVLAWVMSNVIVAHVLTRMNVEALISGSSSGIWGSLIDSIVVIIFTFGVIYVVFNMILTIIDSFYDFCVDWMLGKMTDSPYGERKAFTMNNTRAVLSAMGR